MADDKSTFRELSAQLDDVLAKLQRDDLDVDEALQLHAKGNQLIEQLDKRLSAAESQVKQLKPKRS